MPFIRPATTAEDAEYVGRVMTQPEVCRWLSAEWRNTQVSPRALGTMACKNRRNAVFIVLDDQCEPAGVIGLSDIEDGTANWWGALESAQVRGKGLMTGALKALLDHAFDTLGMRSVYGWCMEPNTPSRRLFERLGFRRSGTLRAACLLDGAPVDKLLFDITRDEHLASRPRTGEPP